MPDLFVEGADSIDHIFERVFSDLDQENKDRLKKEYVTKEKIGEAPGRIRKISLDLIDHYCKQIEPNGYKAMLVATSREAAVEYKSSEKKLSIAIYDILAENGYPEDKTNELTTKI